MIKDICFYLGLAFALAGFGLSIYNLLNEDDGDEENEK